MKIQDLLDISQAADKSTYRKLVVKTAADFGFGIGTAALAIDRGVQIGGQYEFVGNSPTKYLQAAPAMVYAGRDPVLDRMKTSGTAFSYDQAMYIGAGTADLWDFQAPFGFGTGIGVALHLHGRKHFMLGFDRNQPLPRKEEKLVQMLASLQLVATYAQDAAVRLFAEPASNESMPTLTQRQLEVLRWTLAGKSAWEVGQILGISQDTVGCHRRVSMRALETSSKHQAALKAVRLGLLQL